MPAPPRSYPPRPYPQRPYALAYVGLVLTPLFWAGNAVVARGTVETIPPLSMSFWRWVIALASCFRWACPASGAIVP